MERSARRISSIFSLGSGSSGKNSNASHQTSSTVPTEISTTESPLPPVPPKGPSAVPDNAIFMGYIPDMPPHAPPPVPSKEMALGLPAIPPRVPHERPHSTFTPTLYPDGKPPASLGTSRSMGHLPRLEEDGLLLAPYLAARPQNNASPDHSRPNSQAGLGSRSGSPTRLKPLPEGAESPFSEKSNSRPGSRADSRSRPSSPSKGSRSLTPTSDSRRRSWLPGRARRDSHEPDQETHMPRAWILGSEDNAPYNVSPLANFSQIDELWDESGDTVIYLSAQESGRGPSFKINFASIASSKNLFALAHGTPEFHGMGRMRAPSIEVSTEHLSTDDPPSPPRSSLNGSSTTSSSTRHRSPSGTYRILGDSLPEHNRDIRLYLPLPLQTDMSVAHTRLTPDDIETFVAMRNLFAFLEGRPLVATSRHPSVFSILLRIADLLQRYEFTNLDESTLGEEPATRFATFIEEYKLADVRTSREKTIEAIVLGERMRSWGLYNEGFVHAAGKHEDILLMLSPKYHLITDITRKRIERANLDLHQRLKSVRTRLEAFDFPSLFAGSANSSKSIESKVIRFKAWKSGYLSMRRHVLGFYKEKYGSWPPKAKSKKNNFEESGLNRFLLRDLYQDFSDLYDILVDRTSMTTRTTEIAIGDEQSGAESEEPAPRALRRILDEYDRSIPPVQPPVPFDVPLVPSLATTRRNFDSLAVSKQKKEYTKPLSDNEINQSLIQSYNRESLKSSPFIEAFMAFERRTAHAKCCDDLVDLRYGQFIFMYVVLQSLPLVVVDAPGLQHTNGVEYFLCEVPLGSAPWIQESQSQRTGWYSVAGGAGVVSLPADVVEHGVEGIYRRSHCWKVAEHWTASNDFVTSPIAPGSEAGAEGSASFPPPLHAGIGSPDSRSSSPGRPPISPEHSPARGSRTHTPRGSVQLGLEALPLPAGVAPTGARPRSQHDPMKSFADILGSEAARGGRAK